MITKEVNRALKDHMKLQSLRHRKTKRSRIHDDSDSDFYKQLFTDSAKPTSNNQPSDDDLSITKEFEKANEIFEANMTTYPDSPIANGSTTEEPESHHYP